MAPRTRVRRALITVAAASLLLLAGCTDSSDDEEPEATATGETSAEGTPTRRPSQDEAAEVEAAVREFTEVFFTDPDAAYAMVSERCQEVIDPAEYREQLEQAAEDLGELSVETFAVAEFTGETARVTYSVGEPSFDERLLAQPWSREDGEWRWDAC